MGIFSFKTKDQKMNHMKELVKSLQIHYSSDVKIVGERLARIIDKPETAIMQPITLYSDVVEMIISNSRDFKPSEYDSLITYAESIYPHVFIFEDQTPNLDELCRVFTEFFDENNVVSKKAFDVTLFDLFSDKHNYLKWVRSVFSSQSLKKIGEFIVPYALEARSYFPDEDMFTSNLIGVCKRMMKEADPTEVYEDEKKKLYHQAGIYNVDEERILNTEKKLDASQNMLTKSENILRLAEERIKTVDAMTQANCDKIKLVCDTEVSQARADMADIDEKLKAVFETFVEGQKKIIIYDKQQMLKEVFAEAQQKLTELKMTAQQTVNNANLELLRLNQASQDTMGKLNTYLEDDEHVKKLMANVAESQEMQKKLERLSILNEANFEQLSKITQAAVAPAAAVATEKTKTVIKHVNEPEVFEEAEEIEEVIGDVNPFLDESISFSVRFKRVMERKESMVKAGEHFHEMFDDVLIAVMENANPYLIGPSGCGKTYMVNQISRILQVEDVDIGYINEEYDILGFQTANGSYSKPNFYRCYKYGKIAFCDELDNGNSRATVKLNSFLSNVNDAHYVFPGGENVRRHPNFRIIGAGNTAGNGADNNYNTREKIEESVQQRFTPIFIGYDNTIEKQILGPHNDWFEFLVLFRQATDAWGKNNYGDAPGIITTRDAARIRKYLNNGSYNAEKILEYEFIQTKEIGYLTFLENHMRRNIQKKSPATELLDKFSLRVEQKRNDAAVR